MFTLMPGGLWMVLIGALIIRCALVARRQRTMQVVSTLSACTRQNLPLAQALRAASQPGSALSWTLLSMAEYLEGGSPLSRAVREGFPKCPGYVPATIEAAEAIDQVPQALAAMELELLATTRASRQLSSVHPVYPVVIVMFLLMFLTGISLFVIPKFEDFFAEMGLRLPASTAWVMGNLPVFAIMLPVLFLTTLIVLITATVKAFRGRRPDRSSLLSNLADRMKWCTPVVGWFERSYSTARSVNMIRLALESGHTVDQAIAAALKLDLNVCFRWRLWRWLQKVQGGDDVAAAAARCGLGRSIAWAFDTAVHHGAETPAILAHIEAFHRDAYHAMRTIARQVFWPCVVLALAACTGFVVYSMIAPMAAMLQDMVRSMMP